MAAGIGKGVLKVRHARGDRGVTPSGDTTGPPRPHPHPPFALVELRAPSRRMLSVLSVLLAAAPVDSPEWHRAGQT